MTMTPWVRKFAMRWRSTVFHYNFCKIHKTSRCTPAMEAGVTSKLWKIKDIVI